MKNNDNIEFEIIRSSKYRILFFGGIVCVVVLLVAIVLNVTRAKYRVAQSMPLYNATVNYSLADLNIVAMYVGGEAVDSLDSSKQYTLDTNQSTCAYKDGSTIEGLSINYDTDTGSLSISPFTTKGTKCTLYFDEYVEPITIQDILAGKTISTRSDFSTTLTTDTTGTVYQATDDDGTTYYFAGNPTDNWVSFAGFYWRIIRVNGDGSIRLIYNGTSTATKGTSTQLSSTSAFNSSYDDNMYVGYMYTSGSVHGLGTSGTIKGVLDNWYKTNIQDEGYSGYVDTNAGFCGDRSPSTSSSSSNGSGGTGTTYTYYGARYRLYTNKTPTFSCSNSSDLYTTSSSSKGNKALTYPIGLITADEVAYAGGLFYQSDGSASNSSYYLYTNQNYWTMSPSNFNGSALVFHVDSVGSLYFVYAAYTSGVRPVINLRADTTFQAGTTGTSTNPYVVM